MEINTKLKIRTVSQTASAKKYSDPIPKIDLLQ